MHKLIVIYLTLGISYDKEYKTMKIPKLLMDIGSDNFLRRDNELNVLVIQSKSRELD